MDKEDTPTRRRTVLRRVGQVGALAAGVSGTTAASHPQKKDITYDRLTPDELNELFKTQAESLLQQLSSEGYLERPQLPEDARVSRKLSDVVSERTGAAVVNLESADGSVTRQVFISRETADGKLNIFLNRDTESAYAVEITDSGMTPYGFDFGKTGHCNDGCNLNEVCQKDPYMALYEEKSLTHRGECLVVDVSCSCDYSF